MPKPPHIDQPVEFHASIPASLKGWLDLHLWSEVDGRVPHGGYKRFFVERILEYRESVSLDLAPYGAPAGFFIRGRPEAIEALKTLLEQPK